METVDVVNSDFFEGDMIEKDCEIIEKLKENFMIVRLSSDPSLKCLVMFKDGRWEIIENID